MTIRSDFLSDQDLSQLIKILDSVARRESYRGREYEASSLQIKIGGIIAQYSPPQVYRWRLHPYDGWGSED